MPRNPLYGSSPFPGADGDAYGDWFVAKLYVAHGSAPVGYEFCEWHLDSTAALVEKTGGRVNTTSDLAYLIDDTLTWTIVDPATDRPVMVRRAAGAGGTKWEIDATVPAASTGGSVWHAVLTEATGAATWQERRVDSSGAWANTGSLQGNSAYPVQLEGGSFTVKPTAKVIMWADPVTGSYYDLLPVQSADKVSGTYYAGYVIDGNQTWHGVKTLDGGFTLNPDTTSPVPPTTTPLYVVGTATQPGDVSFDYTCSTHLGAATTAGQPYIAKWAFHPAVGPSGYFLWTETAGGGGHFEGHLNGPGGTAVVSCLSGGQFDSTVGFSFNGNPGETYTANVGGLSLIFQGGIITGHSGSFTAGTVTSTSGGTTGLTFTSPTTTPTMTGTLVVANGGTGLTTVTTNGVLYGNGTGALGITSAPSSGQLLIGGSAPDFKTMSGDATITSAGVLTIGNAKVTLAKIANAAASSKLVGSGASGSGSAYVEITLGSGLTMTGTTLSASGGGVTIGGAVSGGTNNTILFVDGSGNLGDSVNFGWNDSTQVHAIVGNSGSGSYTTTITSGSLIAKFCAGSTTNTAARFEDGANTVELCHPSVGAGYFTDGTRTVKLCDGTNNVTYTAANNANWAGGTPPTDLWVAADRLAAALTAAGFPP